MVLEAGDEAIEDARVLLGPLLTRDGVRLDADVEMFVERFLVVERPSGNDRSPGSLAFTAKSALGGAFVGAVADPLVPEALERDGRSLPSAPRCGSI